MVLEHVRTLILADYMDWHNLRNFRQLTIVFLNFLGMSYAYIVCMIRYHIMILPSMLVLCLNSYVNWWCRLLCVDL